MQDIVYDRDFISKNGTDYESGDIIECRPNNYFLFNNGSKYGFDRASFIVIQIDDLVKTKEIEAEKLLTDDKEDADGNIIINKKRIYGYDLISMKKDYPSLITNRYICLTNKEAKKYYGKK